MGLMERILTFITGYEPLRPWLTRRDFNSKNELIKKVVILIEHLSGRNVIPFLNDIMKYLEMEEIKRNKNAVENERRTSDFYNSKYKNALIALSKPINEKVKQKLRHHFIRPLKRLNFRKSNLNKMGFIIGHKMWENCTNERERLKGGRSENLFKQNIKPYLESISNTSSNRFSVKTNKINTNGRIQKVKETIPCRFLTVTKLQAYRDFPQNQYMSYYTFHYAIDKKIYKKAHKLSDLCEYCENGKLLKKKITIFFKNDQNIQRDISVAGWSVEQIDPFILSIADLMEIFKQYYPHSCKRNSLIPRIENRNTDIPPELAEDFEDILDGDPNEEEVTENNICEMIDNYRLIEFHQKIAARQRKAYNRDRQEIESFENSIMIELDFKAKVILGNDPRGKSYEFYCRKQCSILGFGIYYRDKNELFETNNDLEEYEIKLIHVNVISDYLEQDARAAISGFKLLLQQDFLKKILKDNKITHINVWADCGPHFRNGYFVNYLFNELEIDDIGNLKVSLNFHCEKHGKSQVDQHFSVLTRYIKIASDRKMLKNTNDLKDCIEKGVEESNKTLRPDKKPLKVVCLKSNPDEKSRHIQLEKIVINDLKLYYNLTSKDLIKNNIKTILYPKTKDNSKKIILNTTFFSDRTDLFPVDYDYPFFERKIVKKFEGEINISEKKINFDGTIKSKKEKFGYQFQKVDKYFDASKLGRNNKSHSISTPPTLSPVKSQGKSPRETIKPSIISVNLTPDQNDNPGTSGTQAFHLEYNFCDEICGDCQERCIYTRQQLESDNIGQKQIRDELYRHSHPKTRNIGKGAKKRLLTTTEQKDELLNHYRLRHNI